MIEAWNTLQGMANPLLIPMLGLDLTKTSILVGAAALSIYALNGFYRDRQRRQYLIRNASLHALHHLAWDEFEDLCADYFEHQGFGVSTQDPRGRSRAARADGGIDLVVNSGWKTSWKRGRYLVQCKRYGHGKAVGVGVIREAYGVAVANGFTGAFVVTTSRFSRTAVSTAESFGCVYLVDGEVLAEMLRSTKKERA